MVSRAGIHTHLLGCREGSRHRRRINTEAKAKNVAAVWGQNFFNSLLRKLFYTRRFEAKDEFILFFQIILVQFILLFKSSQCTSILGGWQFGGRSLYCSEASIPPSFHFFYASISSNHLGAKSVARQGIESILFPKQQRRPQPSLLYKSFFYAYTGTVHTLPCLLGGRWIFCKSLLRSWAGARVSHYHYPLCTVRKFH